MTSSVNLPKLSLAEVDTTAPRFQSQPQWWFQVAHWFERSRWTKTSGYFTRCFSHSWFQCIIIYLVFFFKSWFHYVFSLVQMYNGTWWLDWNQPEDTGSWVRELNRQRVAAQGWILFPNCRCPLNVNLPGVKFHIPWYMMHPAVSFLNLHGIDEWQCDLAQDHI